MKEKEILRCICILHRVCHCVSSLLSLNLFPFSDGDIIISDLRKVIQALESEVDV